MSIQSAISYFLGANTADGFVSVYEDLAENESVERIWYIKGGPGNGKSTFMRRAAAAAEEAGHRVEYILCSGDPDSLDGIVIPELRTAYVDATSPHVQEPALPGVSGRYLDLSQFYKRSAVFDKEKIETLFMTYKEHYQRAYGFLSAVKAIADEKLIGMRSRNEKKMLEEAGRETAAKRLHEGSGYALTRRFISANTCCGFMYFPESALENGRTVLLQRKDGMAWCWLMGALETCRQCGQKVILCPDPLDSRMPEALILPEAGISFLTVRQGIRYKAAENEIIPLDDPCEDASSDLVKKRERIRKELMKQAEECLKNAKLAHDELEENYSSAVDFKALDRFTLRHIEREIMR